MTGKIFLDTNVLVYCYTQTEPLKQSLAIDLAQYQDAWISTQVLQVLANILYKKFGQTWNDIELTLQEVSQNFQVFTNDIGIIQTATQLANRYGYSFYDCLILSSGLSIGCGTLFSEGMQHGQIIEAQLEIRNPFLP